MDNQQKHSKERLEAMRTLMREQGLDAVLIPMSDRFQSEFVPEHARIIEWLTGFTGSAGFVIVTLDGAAFFTDGRYTLQAQDQVDEALFERLNSAEMPPSKWLANLNPVPKAVGYDGWCFTQRQLLTFYNALSVDEGRKLQPLDGFFEALWQHRPPKPSGNCFIHSISYSGQESDKKIKNVIGLMDLEALDVYLTGLPECVNWLLNVRGSDLPSTPFILSYAALERSGICHWFVDEAQVPDDVRTNLGEKVVVHPLEQFETVLAGFSGKNIGFDPLYTPAAVAECLRQAGGLYTSIKDLILPLKAQKNKVELAGMRAAHQRDGVALSRALRWLEQEAGTETETETETVTEMTVDEKLIEFRSQQPLFFSTSFDTIAGFGAHGAIVHYRATKQTNATITGDSLLLIDSGGQYLDGTTDVTRTLAIGTPTDEQKKHYTLVLKGHIALATARFPAGTTGHALDALARAPLWQHGLDYDHGTGHGVGAFMNVHEGPQGISKRANDVALTPGMILSNEPGYYQEGEYGIRIENLVEVVEITREMVGDDTRTFYGFETLTLVPLDKTLIDEALLNQAERQWVDAYHQRVYNALSELIEADEAMIKWLAEATAPL